MASGTRVRMAFKLIIRCLTYNILFKKRNLKQGTLTCSEYIFYFSCFISKETHSEYMEEYGFGDLEIKWIHGFFNFKIVDLPPSYTDTF